MFGKLRRHAAKDAQVAPLDASVNASNASSAQASAATAVSLKRTHTKAHSMLQASKTLVTEMAGQQPAWTNRLPTDGASTTTEAATAAPAQAPFAAHQPTQPTAIPSVKGGSPWTGIDPR